MPSSKEITSKIGSVKNTRKVTRALEMVSASKIRKAQARMEAARPYARMMRQVISHLSEANPEYKHPFTVTRDNPGTAGYIVVSSDRGLCGGLNNNLFRRLLRDIREWQDNDVGVQVVTIGRKGGQFFRNLRGVEIPAHADSVSEQPQIEDLVGVVKVARLPLLQRFHQHHVAEAGDQSVATPAAGGRRRADAGVLGLYLRAGCA